MGANDACPLMHALDQLNLDKWRPFDFLAKLGEEGKERAKWALKRGGEVSLASSRLGTLARGRVLALLLEKRERERVFAHAGRERGGLQFA